MILWTSEKVPKMGTTSFHTIVVPDATDMRVMVESVVRLRNSLWL